VNSEPRAFARPFGPFRRSASFEQADRLTMSGVFHNYGTE
jgi:hypothetical protein